MGKLKLPLSAMIPHPLFLFQSAQAQEQHPLAVASQQQQQQQDQDPCNCSCCSCGSSPSHCCCSSSSGHAATTCCCCDQDSLSLLSLSTVVPTSVVGIRIDSLFFSKTTTTTSTTTETQPRDSSLRWLLLSSVRNRYDRSRDMDKHLPTGMPRERLRHGQRWRFWMILLLSSYNPFFPTTTTTRRRTRLRVGWWCGDSCSSSSSSSRKRKRQQEQLYNNSLLRSVVAVLLLLLLQDTSGFRISTKRRKTRTRFIPWQFLAFADAFTTTTTRTRRACARGRTLNFSTTTARTPIVTSKTLGGWWVDQYNKNQNNNPRNTALQLLRGWRWNDNDCCNDDDDDDKAENTAFSVPFLLFRGWNGSPKRATWKLPVNPSDSRSRRRTQFATVSSLSSLSMVTSQSDWDEEEEDNPQDYEQKEMSSNNNNNNENHYLDLTTTHSIGSIRAALAVVPPDQAWDTLQRARYVARDRTYTKWPPCIRLFAFSSSSSSSNSNKHNHKSSALPSSSSSSSVSSKTATSSTQNRGAQAAATGIMDPNIPDPLDIAAVIEKYNIHPFSVQLNVWTIIPDMSAMEADWRFHAMSEKEQTLQLARDEQQQRKEQKLRDQQVQKKSIKTILMESSLEEQEQYKQQQVLDLIAREEQVGKEQRQRRWKRQQAKLIAQMANEPPEVVAAALAALATSFATSAGKSTTTNCPPKRRGRRPKQQQEQQQQQRRAPSSENGSGEIDASDTLINNSSEDEISTQSGYMANGAEATEESRLSSSNTLFGEEFAEEPDEMKRNLSPQALWEKQKHMYEEFNGPCIVCLEPDPESTRKLQELREILRQELFVKTRQTKNKNDTSGKKKFDTVQSSSFRPMVPIGSFPTVSSAIRIARQLRRLWEPLVFNVTDLHLLSCEPGVDEMEHDIYEGDIDNDYEAVVGKSKKRFSPSPTSRFPTSAKATKTITKASGMNFMEEERNLVDDQDRFGCDALIMLMGEEVQMDEQLNEDVMKFVWDKGEPGAGAGADVATDTTSGKNSLNQPGVMAGLHDMELDEQDGPMNELEQWLLQEDEDYDEGTVVVIGRTHFFTGEMRMYVGMPATSVVDGKDRVSLGEGVNGDERRRKAKVLTKARGGEWGNVMDSPSSPPALDDPEQTQNQYSSDISKRKKGGRKTKKQ